MNKHEPKTDRPAELPGGGLAAVRIRARDKGNEVNARRHYYTAYGLGIHSDLLLPELARWTGARGDVRVILGDPMAPHSNGRGTYADVAPNEAVFSWEGVALFHVRDGREITVWPEAEVEPDLVRLAMLGIVFSALLCQRGLNVLHASAAIVDRDAVCFAAPKGFGKSTLAAAMYKRGHRVVADDVAAIEYKEGLGARLFPAFPRLNIWPYAAEALGIEINDLPALHSESTKRAYAVGDRFDRKPIKLRAIYVLDRGEYVGIEKLTALDAFFALIPHSFSARYMSADERTPAHLMSAYTPLAREVAVRRLVLGHPVHDALIAAELVEGDLRELASGR